MYEWVKALHVIAVISWMAGLLYLPRLMVYHTDADVGSQQSETFKVMERRLLWAIMTPAMTASWVFGLWIAWLGGFWTDIWFLIKFAGVIALTVCHFFYAGWVRVFAEDRNNLSQRTFRIANEIPTLLMIVIVIMVIVKPFL